MAYATQRSPGVEVAAWYWITIKLIDKELLERKVILQSTSAGEHLPEYAVEKVWWVSMTLKALFQTLCKDYLELEGETWLIKGGAPFQRTPMWR